MVHTRAIGAGIGFALQETGREMTGGQYLSRRGTARGSGKIYPRAQKLLAGPDVPLPHAVRWS